MQAHIHTKTCACIHTHKDMCMHTYTQRHVHAYIHLHACMTTPRLRLTSGLRIKQQKLCPPHPRAHLLFSIYFVCFHSGKLKANAMSHLLGPASPPSSQTHLLSSLTTCMQKSERQTASLKSQTLNLTALILLAPTMTMPGSLRMACL